VSAPTYLDEIVAAHRAAASSRAGDERALAAEARGAPAPRPFVDALLGADGLAVIAEFKRRSPSKGSLAPDADPAVVASEYAAGGAACLSVLTDEAFFGGSRRDLAQARAATALPVLRKDFTVCRADVLEARVMGADAVLLIAAALSDEELAELRALAGQLGLAALVEVHDEAEVTRALAAGATLVGVNQRDLHSFAVDPERACRVAAALPPTVVAVAESGIAGPDDARRLADAGYRAVLVGEALMRAPDRRRAVAELAAPTVAAPPGHRSPATGSARAR
jgi:indole-3-glycerol phosphate synthase